MNSWLHVLFYHKTFKLCFKRVFGIMFVGYASNCVMSDFSPQLLVFPIRSIHFRRYILKKLFDCVGSQLQHVGSFIAAHKLSSYGVQAQQSLHRGSVVPQHVGSQLPNQKLNLHPWIARWILNHWKHQGSSQKTQS